MNRRSLERLVSRGAGRSAGGVGGPGLSLLHGFSGDRRCIGLKVALIGALLVAMAWRW